MYADDCLFCKIVAGQVPVTKIYEDEGVLSFLDIGPISDGHTLVIPKRHYEKIHECPAELLGQVFTSLGQIAGAVAAAMNSDGYNLLCNNGRAAGQVIEHLHFHIVPRHDGDGLFKYWPSVEYEDGKIDSIAGAIRKKL